MSAETLAAAGSPATYREAARAFYGHAGPWVLTALALAALAARVAAGGLSPWDLPVALAVGAWWPAQEWLLHKGLLHAGPVRLAGRSYDPEFARRHRAHHREPWRLDLVILPLYVHVLAPVVVGLAVLVLPTPQLAWTAAAVYFAMALHYEWMHFLVHTRVWPSSRRLQALWRHHRLHHFKNEHYWFGFTSVGVDRLLGTAPDPRSVRTSPTCRTLGHGEPLDDSGGRSPHAEPRSRRPPARSARGEADSRSPDLPAP